LLTQSLVCSSVGREVGSKHTKIASVMMKTNVEEISSVKRRLTVELDAEEVSKKIEDAYRALQKKAKVHGFRPGKVPRNILERYFGQQVAQDVTKGLVNETLPLAFEETNTYPLTMPLVENDALKKGEGFKYAAVMEVKPAFELKDYMGLEVEKEKVSVSDEEVDRQLEEIRKANAKLKPLEENRGARQDDCVIVDYEAFEGDQPIEGIKAQNFLVRIGTGAIHPDFEKGLIGLKAGDTKEITVTFEADYEHTKLAGKKVTFKIQVTDVKTMELPELNDEFAASLGEEFKDLETVKKKIKEDLEIREKKRIDREMKQRLLDKVSGMVDFELPESLVDSELRYAVESVKQNLARIGSNLEKAGLAEEKVRQDFTAASRKRVKDLLVLAEVARQHDLTVSELELAEGFNDLARSMGQEPSVVRRYYEARGMVESLRERLLEEKTLNFLANGAKITQIEASQLSPEPDSSRE
jgi:trigger factor